MIASDINHLVRAYRVAETPKCRNELYKEIRRYYLATMKRVRNGFDERWHVYVESEFDYYLLQCIERWRDDGAMFTTYAYVWMNQKVKTAVVEKYKNKSIREPVFSDMDFDDEEDEDFE